VLAAFVGIRRLRVGIAPAPAALLIEGETAEPLPPYGLTQVVPSGVRRLSAPQGESEMSMSGTMGTLWSKGCLNLSVRTQPLSRPSGACPSYFTQQQWQPAATAARLPASVAASAPPPSLRPARLPDRMVVARSAGVEPGLNSSAGELTSHSSSLLSRNNAPQR
jgi:hypothetical protein